MPGEALPIFTKSRICLISGVDIAAEKPLFMEKFGKRMLLGCFLMMTMNLESYR